MAFFFQSSDKRVFTILVWVGEYCAAAVAVMTLVRLPYLSATSSFNQAVTSK